MISKKRFSLDFSAFLILLIILGWGSSCSQSKKKKLLLNEGSSQRTSTEKFEASVSLKNSKENSPNDPQEDHFIKKKVKPIESGPSQKAKSGTFQDSTEAWGLSDISATHLYAVDWNGDSFVDLVTLPEHYGEPEFFIQRKGKFEKVKSSPLPYGVRASFLTFADFNKDGVLDLLVGTLNQKTELNMYPLRIFLGKRKKGRVTYLELSNPFPTKPYPTASVSLIDANMDGWLDIYLGNWFDTTKARPTLVPDRIYLGKAGGKEWFDGSYILEKELDYNRDLSLYTNARPTFGTSVCDIDQNGYPDLLAASASGYKNKVWLNLFDKENDDRKFIDHGDLSKLSQDTEGAYVVRGGGNSFYMLCQDYNNDGFVDVALGELFHSYDPETRDRSAIMTGKGRMFPPQFIRTEYHKDDGSGSWSQGDRRGIWADLNFDSNIDLIVENSGFPPKSRLVYFEQGSDHSFGDVAQLYGLDIVNPAGSVVLDFDRDGRLDLIIGQVQLRNSGITPRVYAFKNIFPWEGKRVLKIQLQGKKGNKEGLGSSVFLKTNKSRYFRSVDYSYGPLNSQNQSGLWFGLKKDEIPLEVEVRWSVEYKMKSGKKYPLRRVYSLGDLSFKNHASLVLKEDGTKTDLVKW